MQYYFVVLELPTPRARDVVKVERWHGVARWIALLLLWDLDFVSGCPTSFTRPGGGRQPHALPNCCVLFARCPDRNVTADCYSGPERDARTYCTITCFTTRLK